jgi:hypothetical protein
MKTPRPIEREMATMMKTVGWRIGWVGRGRGREVCQNWFGRCLIRASCWERIGSTGSLVICLEMLDSLEVRFVIVIPINVIDWKFRREYAELFSYNQFQRAHMVLFLMMKKNNLSYKYMMINPYIDDPNRAKLCL